MIIERGLIISYKIYLGLFVRGDGKIKLKFSHFNWFVIPHERRMTLSWLSVN